MRIMNILRFIGAVIATVVFASTAHAQLFRAYLSPTGNDANNCTLPTPCRLLPAALAAVADGGDIWMLGSANFNVATVNITKSVSILAVPGMVGSVVATGGPAISVNTAGVKVSLRNLVIAPLAVGAGGTDGISMTNGASLTVDSCLMSNLPGTGIYVNTAARVRIVDSLIRDNGIDGVYFENGPTADISGTKLLGNGNSGVAVYALVAPTTTSAAISDSVISGNTGVGVDTFAQFPGASVSVSVSRSTVSNNAVGVVSKFNPAAVVTVSGNLVTKNSLYGLQQVGSAILESQGNNTVRQNGPTGSDNTIGTITTISGI
jgi:hypothetical protein